MAIRSLLSIALLGVVLTACNKQTETAPAAPPATPAAPATAQSPALAPPVIMTGTRADYTITQTAEGYSLLHKSGKEPAVNVKADQRLRFSDISMSFDKKGNPGAAYRLYYAAFDRAPDHAGLGFWMKALDSGTSLDAVAGMMLSSAEFSSTSELKDEALVRRFYKNILRRDGDEAEISFYHGKLNSKKASRAQVLAEISAGESAQKADQLGLEKGILYLEEGVKYAPFAGTNADPIIIAAVPGKP